MIGLLDAPAHGNRVLAAAVVAVGLVLAPQPSPAQQFTMKFATQTINDVQHEYIKVYKRELEKATDNRITVGRGARIGLGSVVIRAVRPGAAVLGSPAAEVPVLRPF